MANDSGGAGALPAAPNTKILQIGEPLLRSPARALSSDEIRSPKIQDLVLRMQATMREAPGVGLAAPQIGEPLQLAVIEDRAEYFEGASAEWLAERERSIVPFYVLANPRLSVISEGPVEFFEGCLSVAGFIALVRRARAVRVDFLNERAEPMVIEARGWHARILQHEIDHLHGCLYVDRMEPRSFTSTANYTRHWKNFSTAAVRQALGLETK